MAKKSINDKLKASVEASLAQAAEKKATRKSAKKKKTEAELKAEHEDMLASLGIPKATTRRQTVTVYKLQYHNRARLDHTKYPNERMRNLENSPMFATWDAAHKECQKREKEDKENLYFCRMTDVPVDEVPAKLMKKLKERGWGFHS